MLSRPIAKPPTAAAPIARAPIAIAPRACMPVAANGRISGRKKETRIAAASPEP
jgi:hypothetical protein